jgi:flagellar biosynthesis protein FlhF
MKIKKYEVYDMKEALKMIKRDLGPDAVILSSRKIVKNGSFGLFSKPVIEVTAAVDYQAKRESKSANKQNADQKEIYDFKGNFQQHEPNFTQNDDNLDKVTELINNLGLNRFESLINDVGDIKKQINEMKSAFSSNMVVDLDSPLKEYYQLMLKNEMDDVIAYKFLKKIEKRVAAAGGGKLQIKNMIIQFLAEVIPVEKDYFSSLKQKVVAFVGPTGVGKTTTIAKLAANLSLKLKKKVCLISIDTFRIGAVEQLRTYAEIVDVPLFVASTPEELKNIIAKCREYDYIFMDSMGRSQYDENQISELNAFMDVSPFISVVLVLSMSCNHMELFDTFDRYSRLKPEYVIFSKLDETKYFGPMVNLPVIKRAPILLLTNGQNVPEDMEIPDGKKIAKSILNEIPTVWRS